MTPGKKLIVTFALHENAAPQQFFAELVSMDEGVMRVKMDAEFAARPTDLTVNLIRPREGQVFPEPAHTIVQIPARRIVRVADTDPLWNGALIGFGIGFAPAALVCIRGCDATIALTLGAFWGGVGLGIGVLVDHGRKKEGRILYEAPAVARPATFRFVPIVSRERKGALFVINW